MKPVLLAALVGAALLGAAPTGATTGVSIDLARIRVADRLAAAETYELPTFGVRNPGTERTKYSLEVSFVDGQSGRRPDADWFRFTPPTLTLDPGESRPIRTRLRLPPGADPGDYAALIGPRIVAGSKGAQVGASAAARLTFTVKPSGRLGAWLRWLRDLASEQPWLWAVPALGLGAAGSARFGRRFRITVARRV